MLKHLKNKSVKILNSFAKKNEFEYFLNSKKNDICHNFLYSNYIL